MTAPGWMMTRSPSVQRSRMVTFEPILQWLPMVTWGWMTAFAEMVVPWPMVAPSRMHAPGPMEVFSGSSWAEGATKADGWMPGVKLVLSAAKWLTTAEKASVGFPTVMSEGLPGGKSWPSGTMTAPAFVVRNWGRYFSFPRKLISPGSAASRDAIPEKRELASPRMIVPSMRSASSARLRLIAKRWVGGGLLLGSGFFGRGFLGSFRLGRGVFVKVFEEAGGDVCGVFGVEEEGDLGGAEAGFIEDVIVVIGLGLFFDEFADFLEDAFHALDHVFIERLVAALEELTALTIEGDAFLLLHLPVFEEFLFFGVVDGGVFDLFFEAAEVCL